MRSWLILILGVLLCACNSTSSNEVIDGILEVPENRGNPDSRTLKLVYKVLKAKKADSLKEPVVFLMGGPGGATLIMEKPWENHPFRDDRDIILMDQRGTGNSEANCINLGAALFDIMQQDFSLEEDYNATSILLTECKKTMAQKGIDLAGYNSRENAADFEDLRKKLGYKKWNLYGASYGSRLGLTIMRDFPKSVRSAILVGVLPIEYGFFGDRIRSIEKSLLAVFESCEKNEDCYSRYPDLKERLSKIWTKMETEPLRFDYKGKPFVLSSHDAITLLFVSLYDRHSMGNIPFFIEALENGKTEPIIEFLQASEFFWNLMNFPMHYSVSAFEDLPSYNEVDIDKAIEQSEVGFLFSSYKYAIKLLSDWHSYRATNFESQAVISEIPTLLVSGNLDPVTPPSNASSVLKNMKNGYEVIFKDESHHFANPCFFQITEDFINNPYSKPNIDCSSIRKTIEWNLSKLTQ